MSPEDDNFVERRKSFRLDMEKELVDIEWTNDDGQEQQKKLACLDFSKGGLKLDCDQSIPIQTKVSVVFRQAYPDNQKLVGTVYRCIEQENGWFQIVLKLDD